VVPRCVKATARTRTNSLSQDTGRNHYEAEFCLISASGWSVSSPIFRYRRGGGRFLRNVGDFEMITLCCTSENGRVPVYIQCSPTHRHMSTIGLYHSGLVLNVHLLTFIFSWKSRFTWYPGLHAQCQPSVLELKPVPQGYRSLSTPLTFPMLPALRWIKIKCATLLHVERVPFICRPSCAHSEEWVMYSLCTPTYSTLPISFSISIYNITPVL
jgi:hypothetical protein